MLFKFGSLFLKTVFEKENSKNIFGYFLKNMKNNKNTFGCLSKNIDFL